MNVTSLNANALVIGSSSVSIFPLEIVNSRYFQTAQGSPLSYVACTPWMLQRLTQADANTFLSNVASLGFTAIQVSVLPFLIEGTLFNAYGKEPFADVDGTDISQPLLTGAPTTDDTNPDYDYWDHIKWLVNRAAYYNLLVVLVPVWYGYAGRDWYGHVTDENAGGYGDFLATIFGGCENVWWMFGGDCNPTGDTSEVPPGLDAGPKITATNLIAAAIFDGSSGAPLGMYHGHFESTPRTWFGSEDWYNINSVYTYLNTYALVISEYDATTSPVIMTEAFYEDRTVPPILSEQELRANSWWAVTNGGAGAAYGNMEIYPFSDFPAALSAPARLQHQFLCETLASLSMNKLVPDHRSGNTDKMLASGYSSGANLATSATASDGENAICYFPNTRGTISVRMESFNATATLKWLDPRDGNETIIGSFANTGNQAVTYPVGWEDAVLIGTTP